MTGDGPPLHENYGGEVVVTFNTKKGERRGFCMDEESTFMPNLTLGYGLFLVVWGIAVSVLSASDSITSYFPGFPRCPVGRFGLVGRPIRRRGSCGCTSLTFGLLCALGGTRFFMVMGDGLDYASLSMLMLFLTGSAYTALTVRSFIKPARQAIKRHPLDGGPAPQSMAETPPIEVELKAVDNNTQRQLNFSAAATVAFAFSFLMLAMVFTGPAAEMGERPDYSVEWWKTPLSDRHLMDLPMDTLGPNSQRTARMKHCPTRSISWS